MYNPNSFEAHNSRGRLDVALGEYQKAIDDFTAALQIYPEYGDAYGNRGVAYEKLGDTKRALADYKRAAEIYKRTGDSSGYAWVQPYIEELERQLAE